METKQKNNPFSIWDSVVNEKIQQIEELEKKYRKRGLQISALEQEIGTLRDNAENLDQQKNKYEQQLAELQSRTMELEKENRFLESQIEGMEHSTSWKITKPVRKIMDMLRK